MDEFSFSQGLGAGAAPVLVGWSVGNELSVFVVSLQRLSELLKSKKPEDLQEANRLIKNMVKEVRRVKSFDYSLV